jgi:hypothetical protein
MPKATNHNGKLAVLEKCYVDIPNATKIPINTLPDIGDSKNAVYNADSIIGRASPLHTYHYSDTRMISIQFHFVVQEKEDIQKNLSYLRAIQSASYPRVGDANLPFRPPPICKLRCGNLLSVESDLCVVLQQYSVRFPTDVAWDPETYCPYKFDVDTSWWVVYSSPALPDQSKIYISGR